MNHNLRNDADAIIKASLQAVLPDEAVQRALKDYQPAGGRTILVAAGKAAWQMANAAVRTLGHVDAGVVVTKYDHVMGEIPGVTCYEAGHPVPDENSFAATQAALAAVSDLTPQDTVLFLLSGGGSALFESPKIPGEELQDITSQMLASGADIVEMNTIRKRLSNVKGGRFALTCAPAKVLSIVLSDILGDPLDMIASGPAYPDASTCAEAVSIAKKYDLKLSDTAWKLLEEETPKELTNVTTQITGSVRELCAAAAAKCRELGYEPVLLTDMLSCEAREAGSFLASILKTHAGEGKKLAFLAGGETVVHLTGKGKGGRNQELALAAAPGIAGLRGAAVFSFGSDGTDGPTDAAGGYADCTSMKAFAEKGIDVFAVLKENDAYHALKEVDGLIMTGPTGTNVNDIAVAMLNPA
ncbi:MAG: glycerate kinase [Lachnospiraceae bacterium]|nr:glycerate kinase [Lachnospiraceae bacterium]